MVQKPKSERSWMEVDGLEELKVDVSKETKVTLKPSTFLLLSRPFTPGLKQMNILPRG